MRIYINLDKDGNVTGIFHEQQYPGQKTLDEADAKVVAYKEAKAARIALTNVTLEDRVAELETKISETKT